MPQKRMLGRRAGKMCQSLDEYNYYLTAKTWITQEEVTQILEAFLEVNGDSIVEQHVLQQPIDEFKMEDGEEENRLAYGQEKGNEYVEEEKKEEEDELEDEKEEDEVDDEEEEEEDEEEEEEEEEDQRLEKEEVYALYDEGENESEEMEAEENESEEKESEEADGGDNESEEIVCGHIESEVMEEEEQERQGTGDSVHKPPQELSRLRKRKPTEQRPLIVLSDSEEEVLPKAISLHNLIGARKEKEIADVAISNTTFSKNDIADNDNAESTINASMNGEEDSNDEYLPNHRHDKKRRKTTNLVGTRMPGFKSIQGNGKTVKNRTSSKMYDKMFPRTKMSDIAESPADIAVKNIVHGMAHCTSYAGKNTNYTSSQDMPQRHMASQHSDNDYISILVEGVVKHMVNIVADAEEIFSCNSLPSEYRQIAEGRFVCEKCGLSYASKKSLKTHINNKHAHNTKNSGIINNAIVVMKVVNKMLSSIVDSEKPGTGGAANCNKSTNTSTLTTNKMYACEECPHKFSLAENLTRHINVQHPASKKSSISSTNESANISTATLTDANATTTTRTTKVRQRIQEQHPTPKQNCSITSTNDKSFSCKECGQNFSRRSNMLQHELEKHSAPTHKCAGCSKTFSRKSGLKRHILHRHVNVVLKVCKCGNELKGENIISVTNEEVLSSSKDNSG